MDSDLPVIDIFDQEQSELPNLDGWIFDLAGSNNGISPGLPVLDQDVNDSTNLSQPLAAPLANCLPEFVSCCPSSLRSQPLAGVQSSANGGGSMYL